MNRARQDSSGVMIAATVSIMRSTPSRQGSRGTISSPVCRPPSPIFSLSLGVSCTRTASLGMRVLLADDHALVRAGIRALLAGLPDVETVVEAGDGQEALAVLRETKPDLALIDIAMPGLNGLELAARVAREAPGTRLVILSMHGTPAHVAQALRAGV